jgi:hypothetical protein
MYKDKSLSLASILTMCGSVASCAISDAASHIGEFWIERNGDTVALYENAPSQGDCILATGPTDVIGSISEDRLIRGEITYELQKYPVFVPTYVAGETAYDRPANVRGQLVERTCVSHHLYWITNLQIL